jgi:integrase
MGRKKIPGLQKRFGVWQIDKKIFGQRVCESTGTGNLEEAERILARIIEDARNKRFFGVRPKKTFIEASTKYLRENQHKASIQIDAKRLSLIVKFIGDVDLSFVHMGTLQKFINYRREHGIKTKTINHDLEVIRRILNLAATEWINENGKTWLQTAPKIKLLKVTDNREPYPLNWEEQDRLFKILPDHLKTMALFAVNTGCRDTEIRNLKWEWEIKINNNTSIFVIPKHFVKNREDRLVVLNDIASKVIDSVRGKDKTYVFAYKGKPITRILNSAWKNARKKAGLPQVRVHDLKHTFGRRLRSANVSFEDRQDLLGHKSGRITTHYSSAELQSLIAAANKACDRNNCGIIINTFKQDKNAQFKFSAKRSRECHEQNF